MSEQTPSAEKDARLESEDYDALFDVLATIDLVSESDRAGLVGYFDTPDGQRVAEVVESIIVRHLTRVTPPGDSGIDWDNPVTRDDGGITFQPRDPRPGGDK